MQAERKGAEVEMPRPPSSSSSATSGASAIPVGMTPDEVKIHLPQ
jgi:hypothetical protein